MRLGLVTAFFNWTGAERKIANLKRFLGQPSIKGAPVVVVECAQFGERFTLPDDPRIVRVRCRSMLWQKECLLNIGIRHLPTECDAVAWLDADILFDNENWMADAGELLERHSVVQLFDSFRYLAKDSLRPTACDEIKRSFMGGLRGHQDPNTPAILGHPGFAWAARRDVLQSIGGLYERSIIGGADRLIAHALFGDYFVKAVSVIARGSIFDDYLAWARRTYSVVQGNVSLVPGSIRHLWHGAISDRQYYMRHVVLDEFAFDPVVDVVHNSYGCLEWATQKPAMHAWVADYFVARNENR